MFLGLPLSVVHDEVSPGISGYHPLCCLWMFEHFFFDLLFLGCLLTFIIGCGPFSFSQSSVVEHFRGIPLSHNMSPKAQLNLMFIPLSFGVWQKKKLFCQYCFITLAFASFGSKYHCFLEIMQTWCKSLTTYCSIPRQKIGPFAHFLPTLFHKKN